MKKSFVIRIEEDMYKKLEKWAHDEFRSVNGQIEYLINQGLVKTGRNKLKVDDAGENDSALTENDEG